jgi:hypothetical protein
MSPRYSARRVPGRFPRSGASGCMQQWLRTPRSPARRPLAAEFGAKAWPTIPSRHFFWVRSVGRGVTIMPTASLGQALPGLANDARQSDEAAEQGDEADEAGASDGASQLIPGVRWTGWRCTERTRPAVAAPSPVGACPRIAACAKRRQFIGKNPQLMRISGNSRLQGAVSGVAEAEVASLSSEARAWPLPLFARQGGACVQWLRTPRSSARRPLRC